MSVASREQGSLRNMAQIWHLAAFVGMRKQRVATKDEHARHRGTSDHVRSVARTHLQPDVFNVALDGPRCDENLLRNFLGGETGGNQFKNLMLSFTENRLAIKLVKRQHGTGASITISVLLSDVSGHLERPCFPLFCFDDPPCAMIAIYALCPILGSHYAFRSSQIKRGFPKVLPHDA